MIDQTDWDLYEKALTDCNRLLVTGPPGVGKTYLAQNLGRDAAEVDTIKAFPNMPAQYIQGMFIPKEDGSLGWLDGPATKAMRLGHRVIIDEIGNTDEEAQGMLLGYCDSQESAYVTLPTGKTLRPANGYQVVATSNFPPEALPDALRSRFTAVVHVGEVNPDAMELLPYDWRQTAERSLALDDAERGMSMRQWLEFDRLVNTVGWHMEMAAAVAFGRGAGQELMDTMRIAGCAEFSDSPPEVSESD